MKKLLLITTAAIMFSLNAHSASFLIEKNTLSGCIVSKNNDQTTEIGNRMTELRGKQIDIDMKSPYIGRADDYFKVTRQLMRAEEEFDSKLSELDSWINGSITTEQLIEQRPVYADCLKFNSSN